MIKVKDTKRLKAFGFDHDENSGVFVKYVDAGSFVGVDEVNAEVYFLGDSAKLLDVFFDLQAAGLLERVEGK